MKLFGEICETTQGVQIPSSAQFEKDGFTRIKYLYISDLLGSKSDKYIEDIYPHKVVTENDLVMANTGSPGKVFRGISGVLSNNLFKLTFKKEIVDKEYLYFILSSSIFQNILQQQLKGGIQKHLGHKTISLQYIPLPPLPQQQKIANILDAADALRQKDKALLAKYDELTQALFLDMFGDPVSNPKGWEMIKLEGFCEFENGDRSSNYPSGDEVKSSGKLFLSSGDIKKGRFIVKDSKFISNDKYNSLKRGKCYRNDVLMTLRGNGTGKSAIFDCEYEEGFINAQMVIIRPNNKCDPNYLVLQLNNPVVFKRLISFNSGSAQPQLSAQSVKEFKVFVPPVNLQNQFAERVKVIEQQKAIAQKSLEKSEELFNSLLQKAFKGELV
jgi:type I restriction enzyme S subunit